LLFSVPGQTGSLIGPDGKAGPAGPEAGLAHGQIAPGVQGEMSGFQPRPVSGIVQTAAAVGRQQLGGRTTPGSATGVARQLGPMVKYARRPEGRGSPSGRRRREVGSPSGPDRVAVLGEGTTPDASRPPGVTSRTMSPRALCHPLGRGSTPRCWLPGRKPTSGKEYDSDKSRKTLAAPVFRQALPGPTPVAGRRSSRRRQMAIADKAVQACEGRGSDIQAGSFFFDPWLPGPTRQVRAGEGAGRTWVMASGLRGWTRTSPCGTPATRWNRVVAVPGGARRGLGRRGRAVGVIEDNPWDDHAFHAPWAGMKLAGKRSSTSLEVNVAPAGGDEDPSGGPGDRFRRALGQETNHPVLYSDDCLTSNGPVHCLPPRCPSCIFEQAMVCNLHAHAHTVISRESRQSKP